MLDTEIRIVFMCICVYRIAYYIRIYILVDICVVNDFAASTQPTQMILFKLNFRIGMLLVDGGARRHINTHFEQTKFGHHRVFKSTPFTIRRLQCNISNRSHCSLREAAQAHGNDAKHIKFNT